MVKRNILLFQTLKNVLVQITQTLNTKNLKIKFDKKNSKSEQRESKTVQE